MTIPRSETVLFEFFFGRYRHEFNERLDCLERQARSDTQSNSLFVFPL
jgi:hypothetical protein